MDNSKFNQISPEEHPSENLPGLGLASYGCLLGIFFFVGLFGLLSSSLSLFQSQFTREPFSFSPGDQVKVWRLQPMRDAKLLSLTEVPDWYHDESSNGTQACAMSSNSLLRLENGVGWKIPYSDIASVSSERGERLKVAIITMKNDEQIFCFFEPGEGVERFTRVLDKELR